MCTRFTTGRASNDPHTVQKKYTLFVLKIEAACSNHEDTLLGPPFKKPPLWLYKAEPPVTVALRSSTSYSPRPDPSRGDPQPAH